MSLGTCIVGTGSPNGDDQAGWQFVEMLQCHRDLGVASFAVRDPVQLLGFACQYERLIIVDACLAGDSPGTITRLEWPDPRITAQHSHSTHRFSVAETLQLAKCLGQLPDRVVLFGIEVDQCRPLSKLTAAVSGALVELESRVRAEISTDDRQRAQSGLPVGLHGDDRGAITVTHHSSYSPDPRESRIVERTQA